MKALPNQFIYSTVDSPSGNQQPVTLELPEGLKCTIFHHIQGVPTDEWNRCLKREDFFLSKKYLDIVEKSGMPGMQYRYVVLYTGGEVKAILYFQMVNLSDEELGGVLDLQEYGGIATGISNRINQLLFHPAKGKTSWLLVSGNLMVSGNHGIRAVNEVAYREAVKAIEPIKRYFVFEMGPRNRMVAFMVKDFYEEENSVASPILSKDYFLLNTDPEMIFEANPQWNDFNDYLNALSSKYRIRANQAIAKMKPVTVRELDAEEVEASNDRIFELNSLVMRKAPVRLTRPGQRYFINMKRGFGKYFRVNGIYLDHKLVAFTSALWNHNHYEAHYIGLDYECNKQCSLYQNMLYLYIRDFIESRSERLYFGRTALEIKSATGARPHQLACYFRFTNRMLNTLARPLVAMTGPGVWVPRDPFKAG